LAIPPVIGAVSLMMSPENDSLVEPAVPEVSALAPQAEEAEPAAPEAEPPQAEPPQAEAPRADESEAGATTPSSALTRPSYVFLVAVTLVNLVADVVTKGWAKDHFDAAKAGAREVVIIPDLMNFIYAQNRGGAWGFLQNETESLRRPFFLVVSVAAIVFIVTLYRKLEPQQWILKWGLPMVLGGALGNFVDRVHYGFVIDFIDVWVKVDSGDLLSKFMDVGVRHWPTFNIADVSICIGVALMAIDMFMPQAKAPPKAEAPPKADPPKAEPSDASSAPHAP
jgi:signal peptidase II